jgi:hypothetical protein
VGKCGGVERATDGSMAHARGCWITKATQAHSEYVILLAFPLQQCLHERASMLHYTYSTLTVLLMLNPALKVYSTVVYQVKVNCSI